ncbi:MAG TPA: tail fiber domain-containing protein [Verrucomicrobiae bacterium]|nr:tail fiber domain-containing protein [Verrucomicrobiae bacterium]
MKALARILVCLMITASTGQTQVPEIMNYQGRVAVNGTNFDGTGQFKFSLVDDGTTIPPVQGASAVAQVSYGRIVGFTVTAPGSGYTSAPSVTITDSTGQGATATAHISNGRLSYISVNSQGTGYSSNPTVTIAAPPMPQPITITFWSNDGTGTNGGAPNSSIPLPVQKGLYSILLGDSAQTNMTQIPPLLFTNSDVRIRIWFNDGPNGFQQLVPDQRIASVGYAMRAHTVDNISGGQILNGDVQAVRLNIGIGHTLGGYLGTIGGGSNNTASGDYTTIAGGANNIASAHESTVGGGSGNAASADSSTIAGGSGNIAGGFFAAIGGGQDNLASNYWATIAGGFENVATGQYTSIGGGDHNSATGYSATIGGGSQNHAIGDAAAVGGGIENTVGYRAMVGGGSRNVASGAWSTVAGGDTNVAEGWHASIGGGRGNRAAGTTATVAGGNQNQAIDDAATVGGGQNNISTNGATVSGGRYNTASGPAATIAGGESNFATNQHSTVSGGSQNEAIGYSSVIGGGAFNVAGSYATIGGGSENSAGDLATVAGGRGNDAAGWESCIGGGEQNGSFGDYATVAGGRQNYAMGEASCIGGGYANRTTNDSAAVVGGYLNVASGSRSTVCGGELNSATNDHSIVAGGYSNTAGGKNSFAAGYRSKALHDGAFVWGDLYPWDITSTTNNQFTARCSGGVRFFSDTGASVGVVLAPGGNGWSAMSDRNAKENFIPVEARAILEKVAAMPVTTWNMKTQDPSIRHIGPMAQDFQAAFQVGEDDRHISTSDADGVTFAAIKGLYDLVQEKDAEIARLTTRDAETRARLTELERTLKRVSQQMGQPRPTHTPVYNARTPGGI